MRAPLLVYPAEEKTGEIRSALAANRCVVLTAPPGSGKTTCIPPALLGEDWLGGRGILMLEPRRMAARTAAGFIASKLGEPVGRTVGYHIRLERKTGPDTRLEVLTEGLLAQRILSDPELGGTGLVVFDEFHERSLQCDLGFALALEVRRALRPDLRLLVMSATLDAGSIANHIGDAVTVRAEGRMFPVKTEFLGDMAMSAALARAVRETDGDILCFLPGEGEIRRTAESIRGLAGVDTLPLYGAMPKEEQDRVFAPSPRRKVILSTSIAETSVTIPGVTCVIDSGLMRVSRFSPSTGMSSLVTLPLTKDRAEQRRGRAGRVRPGVCYRLWTEGEDRQRPERMTPEILDADLSRLVLASVAWGAIRRTDLPWPTPPPAGAWDQASKLLGGLGALDGDGRLTRKGETMSKMAMHPRLANMVLGAGGETPALLAAVLEEGSRSRETDIRKIVDEVRETPNRPFSRRVLQLARKFSAGKQAGPKSCREVSEGAALALAYPDRIARNRGNGTFQMVSGGGAALESGDPLAKEPFIVCCELDDRPGDARIFLACPVAADEIERLYRNQIRESSVCEWDRREERVKCAMRRMLGEMALSEKNIDPGAPGMRESVSRALLDGIRQKGAENMPCWTKESLHLASRVNFLHRHGQWPEISGETLLHAVEGFTGGMTRWRDLEKLDLCAAIDFVLAESGHDRRELDRMAPARLEVPSGSRLTVRYDGDEPTVEARLQECFGMMDTPRVAGGAVPVVMTLLSPAHRPVQVTKDLAGFWRNGYQLVRKDMRGRYPKHYWPEDPFTAVATRHRRPGKDMSSGA